MSTPAEIAAATIARPGVLSVSFPRLHETCEVGRASSG